MYGLKYNGEKGIGDCDIQHCYEINGGGEEGSAKRVCEGGFRMAGKC